MNYVGYFKRFDQYFNSRDLTEMFVQQNIDREIRAFVLKYLLAGNFLMGWMSFLREEDGTPIGNNDYFTDGTYIWPNYYIYYLNKHENLEIDKSFIEHIKKNNFIVPQLTKEHLSDIEREYFENLRRYQISR